ncbi:MAG: hypothetical protein ABI743_03740 [bacterium]
MTKTPLSIVLALAVVAALASYMRPGGKAGAAPQMIAPGVFADPAPVPDDTGAPGSVPGSSGDSVATAGDAVPQIPPVEELPALPAVPQALLLDYMTCLGLPIGEELPAKSREIGTWRFDPSGIYQIACVVTDDANQPIPNLTWNFTIRGGKMSDILLESYPPQLGNGVDAIALQTGVVAFQLDPGRREPASLGIKATDGTTTWEKTILLVPSDMDSTTLEMVPAEVLLGLASGATATPKLVVDLKLDQIDVVEHIGDFALHLKDTSAAPRDPWVLQDLLLWRPEVRYVEPNYIHHAVMN